MFARRTATRVRDGRVQKKNNWTDTYADHYFESETLQCTREQAAPGCVHVVDERDLERFFKLVPDWNSLQKGLRTVVLSSGRDNADGWCRCDGVLALCAWSQPFVDEYEASWVAEHRAFLERVQVPIEPSSNGNFTLYFDRDTARAFQLLHVLPHELGHHHDRMTSPGQKWTTRGEDYAEEFAYKMERELWPKYKEYFGVPGRRNRKVHAL